MLRLLNSFLGVSSEQDTRVYDLAEAVVIQLVNEHFISQESFCGEQCRICQLNDELIDFLEPRRLDRVTVERCNYDARLIE
ncbi:hypothetical protein AB6C62_23775 [Vibrio splendidus]|uniref:hypothetical protein n=1 Tax=Vibrio splendidus TaxID=29497 RepID=UPI001056D10B|nr:hypothetical protein [Vibrio splendidus]